MVPVRKSLLGVALLCSLPPADVVWAQTFEIGGSSSDQAQKQSDKKGKKQTRRPASGEAPAQEGMGWGSSIEVGRNARAAEDHLKKGDNAGFFFGGCKVLFHLAEGTFARVYRGMRAESGEPFAVKVLRKRFCTDPESVARFNKEAQEGMKLKHPNIVQIVDYGNAEKQHYMLMEYVEGSNLRDLLKIRMRIDVVAAVPMMLGLSRALKYSIDQGVTHIVCTPHANAKYKFDSARNSHYWRRCVNAWETEWFWASDVIFIFRRKRREFQQESISLHHQWQSIPAC